MDIMGYDSVIFTMAMNENAVHLLFSRVRELWPRMLIELEKPDTEEAIRTVIGSNDCIVALRRERRSIIYFYRDEEMRQHFKERGWVLDSLKEGPLSVHFRKRREAVFELTGVTEVSSGETIVGSVDPYPAILCAPELLEVTVVSPADPAIDPFSRQILNLVLSSVLKA